MRRAPLIAMLLIGGPSFGAAQDSQFGIQGLGTPARWESVSARTTGGALAPFDAGSPLSDAPLGELTSLTSFAGVMTSFRKFNLAGEEAALRSTRFPSFTVAGPIGPFIVAAGFSEYLQRSFEVVRSGTVMLRELPEPYTDSEASDGGASDLRIALARRIGRTATLGVSMHLINGLARQTVTRRFADSATYRTATQSDDTRFKGFGVAGGIVVNPAGKLRVAGWVRSDTELEFESADSSGTYDLPIAAGGGVAWRPINRILIAAAVDWRRWSSAELPSFDTFAWSVGAELGNPAHPLRVGVRGGELPFGSGGAAPTEFAAAVGLGFRFSSGRGELDVGVERLTRDGTGLRESMWNVMAGITVKP